MHAQTVVNLKREKEQLKMDDTSVEAYAKEIDRASMFMMDDRGVLLEQAQRLYKVWKENKEDSYKRRMKNLDVSIMQAERAYNREKEYAKQAITNYQYAKARRESQAIYDPRTLGGLSYDPSVVLASFPSETQFYVDMNKKLAMAHAKTIVHPQATNLIALIKEGKSATDDSWRNIENFYHNPLPSTFFDFNIPTDSADAARNIQAYSNPIDVTRLALKTFKTMAGQAEHLKKFRVLINTGFDGVDMVLADFNDSLRGEVQSHLNSSIDVAREVIPRIAGTNETALKEMYATLNNELRIIYDNHKTSDNTKQMLDKTITDNNSSMLYQLEQIRTYQRSHPSQRTTSPKTCPKN
jgi:hypothetical protein